MENVISKNDPIYEDYYEIIIKLYNFIPHKDYTNKFISSQFFHWADTYIDHYMGLHEKLLQKYVDENKQNSNECLAVKKRLIKLLNTLESIEPFSVKISDFDKEFYKSDSFESFFADYDNSINLLKLSTKEENKLNNGYFELEIEKRFTSLKDLIKLFYLRHKDNYLNSLNKCFTALAEFEPDKKILDEIYNDEPNLYFRNIDINDFNYIVEKQNKILSDFISDKKILVNHFNADNTSTKTDGDIKNYPPIFKDEDSYQKFIDVAEYLDIDLKNINDRNNQTKLNGIWQSSLGKKLIKRFTEKQEYIRFLNETYGSDFNSRSMSSGKNHVYKIDEYLGSK